MIKNQNHSLLFKSIIINNTKSKNQTRKHKGRFMHKKLDLDLVESIEPKIYGRYAVVRKNSFFGSKQQIMSLMEDRVIIADFPDLENSRETFTLDENIRIVPDKRNILLRFYQN